MTTTTTIDLAVDATGIATLTIDVRDRPMNVFTPELTADLAACVERVATDAAIRGAIMTSARREFVVGADIKDLVTAYDRKVSAKEAFGWSQALTRVFRRLETCGKPFVAAINGSALGGGFELALACHYRVLSSDAKATVGLPEVKIGLMPGAGGTQRVPRLAGIAQAARLITEGHPLAPAEAQKMGLVHEVAAPADLLARARAWLDTKPEPVAPWDRKGFKVPGGASLAMPAVSQVLSVGTALVSRATLRNYPAPPAILSAIYEGTNVPFDRGLALESKYFAKLLTGPVARNMMRTLFVNKNSLDKLVRRPAGVERRPVRTLGVLGAGMMGGGIAHVAALAGIEVVLLDSTAELAERGKQYSARLLARDVEKGRRSEESAAEVLARIRPTADYASLGDCELVIEAVFERRDVKADVTAKAVAAMRRDATFASNTSTLPIASLATASSRPKQFIGIHFFSPVERMPLVEIIVAKKTSEATVAHALDFVAQLRKTPIVVGDSRGFYTTRVFGAYCHEGQALLAEGVEPALIENAGRMAGMPVGPLAVTDEVSIELQYRASQQAAEDLGPKFVPPVSWPVLRHFVEDLKRLGRKSGAGFYDYPEGAAKRLWPGLAHEYPRAAVQPDVAEVRTRLLYAQALEAARCVEEGVVTTPAEADVGSILGVGFPPWTGGTLSLIDTVGVAAFVAECERLAKKHGPRFRPSKWLRERAKAGQTFHPAAGA
jgi:3-hydroxyacyl-CoA dehydrogenase/enoyl-CoA hydratase/3-hydroxybutyryl-CoA epimerase